MFQNKLITAKEFKDFFITHNIPLQAEILLPDVEISRIFIDAYAKGKTFAQFVLICVINSSKTGLETNFKSYEDIEESYVQFVLGYISANQDKGVNYARSN